MGERPRAGHRRCRRSRARPQKLGRLDELLPAIAAGPDDVRAAAARRACGSATPAGAHYAAVLVLRPALRILNGFIQSLVGLYDFAQITGDAARRSSCSPTGEAEAQAETPTYDTGAWSLYSRGAIKRESDLNYHELLRDFLANLCDRTARPVSATAETHFTTYLSTPPALALRTTRAARRQARQLRFPLSKISTRDACA